MNPGEDWLTRPVQSGECWVQERDPASVYKADHKGRHLIPASGLHTQRHTCAPARLHTYTCKEELKGSYSSGWSKGRGKIAKISVIYTLNLFFETRVLLCDLGWPRVQIQGDPSASVESWD